MIKHLIFDFDGTLADSEEMGFKIMNELAKKHKFNKMEISELQHIKSLSYTQRFKYLNIPLIKVPQIAMEIRRNYQLVAKDVQPIPGILDMLNELKSLGYQLYIVSSNALDNIRIFLKNHHIDIFTDIHCESNFFGKHARLRHFLRSNRLHVSEVIYIADEVRDIESCRKIKMRIMSVSWGFDRVETLKESKPDFIANSPSEIVRIIRSL